MIPHSRPTLSDEEIQAATAVLRSGQIAQGPRVAAFEDEMARWLGVRGAVALSSGTAALHLSLLALGISAGDEVILPSYVCAALYHAVVAAGARPVLAEIDEGSLNLDPDDVKRRLTKKTRAVIVVHSFGLPADPGPFLSLGPPVIEDCAQAAGACLPARQAELNGHPVGSSGQLSIFSFYATKMFTTGEGGMVATDDPTLLDRLRDLREYDERDDLKPRMNAKLTDLASAIGLAQLKKLPAFIARRRAIAGIYRQALAGAPVDLPPDARTSGHIYHRFIVRLKREPVDRVIAALEKEEIHCRRPVYQPLHRLMGLTGFSTSERVWQHALSLPCYPSLTDQEAQCVAATLTGSL